MIIKIRPALAQDSEDVGRLYQQSAAHLKALGDETDFQFSAEVYLRDGFGEHPAFWGIVAEGDNGLLGYLLYQFSYDTDRARRILFVLDLLVDEEARGQGIGKKLMNEAVDIANEKGAKSLQWAVYRPNQAAIDFYQAWGGEKIGDIFLMEKDIS